MNKCNKITKLVIIFLVCSIIEMILNNMNNIQISQYAFGFPFTIITIHELNHNFWNTFIHGIYINLTGIIFDLLLYFMIYKIFYSRNIKLKMKSI